MASEGLCSPLTRWQSIALTHVEFPEGDLLGHVLAYVTLLPVAILVGIATLVVFGRDLRSISFLGGLILNEGSNRLLKHLLREPRPCPLVHSMAPAGVGYGMPSSHAQLIWFFVVYLVLFRYRRRHCRTDPPWRHVMSVVLLLGVALSVSYSRVYLLYHTCGQVFCGGAVGGALGALWFFFTQKALAPLFPRIAAWPISEYFQVRDESPILDILPYEYTVAISEAPDGRQKLGRKQR